MGEEEFTGAKDPIPVALVFYNVVVVVERSLHHPVPLKTCTLQQLRTGNRLGHIGHRLAIIFMDLGVAAHPVALGCQL